MKKNEKKHNQEKSKRKAIKKSNSMINRGALKLIQTLQL